MPNAKLTRKELVLAALATAETHAFSPVQLQKLFFLLDRNASKVLGGPFFAFGPYHYGPFDRAVYDELDALRAEGLVEVETAASWRTYRIAEDAAESGRAALARLSQSGRSYVEEVSSWVRSLSFTELVSSIYKEYPDMKVNSVFQG